MTLPRSLDDLRGLRAARWLRESTAGQLDNFGPDAQREQQDRAIERWGLVDTGLAWEVAHSGFRKKREHDIAVIASTTQWSEMLAAAGSEFDVLVVGYVSRFARDTELHFTTRRRFHAAGAAILFVDERILTSDDDTWETWAREAVEAEAYSRKLGRRIREGYAAKRRRLGEPGGRPPFGFERDGRPPQLRRDDARCDLVGRAFERARAGDPDRAVAAALGIPIDTVRGILTNPIYVGRLRDGTPAGVEPVVDEATWQHVQRLRSARNTRGGRPSRGRTYALPMLRCAACGRRLIGDQGRYRHREPCPEFGAARRRRAWKHQLVKWPGESYPAAFYEDLVPHALEAVALSTRDLVDAAAWYADQRPAVDELALRRVTADRERCLSRYARDRDVAALERRMAELDEQERALREVERVSSSPDWSEVLALVRDLPALWADPDARAEDRRALAEAAFASIDALGARRLRFTMTPAAGGVQVLVSVGARGTVASVTCNWPPSLHGRIERSVGTGG